MPHVIAKLIKYRIAKIILPRCITRENSSHILDLFSDLQQARMSGRGNSLNFNSPTSILNNAFQNLLQPVSLSLIAKFSLKAKHNYQRSFLSQDLALYQWTEKNSIQLLVITL